MPIHNSRKSAGNFPYRTARIALVVGICRVRIRKRSESVPECPGTVAVANLRLFVFRLSGLYGIRSFGV